MPRGTFCRRRRDDSDEVVSSTIDIALRRFHSTHAMLPFAELSLPLDDRPRHFYAVVIFLSEVACHFSAVCFSASSVVSIPVTDVTHNAHFGALSAANATPNMHLIL